MQIQVRCRCAVARTIDTTTVGPWRLRCKTCGDVIYDPQSQPPPRVPPPPTSDEENSQFNDWLQGSAELKVLMSSEGDDEQESCAKHPKYKIVAACNRCAALLCKRCLDRIGDSFTCGDCVAKELRGTSGAAKVAGGLKAFFGRLFGK